MFENIIMGQNPHLGGVQYEGGVPRNVFEAEKRIPICPTQIDVSFHAWRFHSAETGMAANSLPKGTMSLPV